MPKPDDEKSTRNAVLEMFEQITVGLSKAEKDAVLGGYTLGLHSRLKDAPIIKVAFPNFGTVVLQNIGLSLQDPTVQGLLAEHRNAGDSPSWLQHQICESMQLTIDGALGKTPLTPNLPILKLDD